MQVPKLAHFFVWIELVSSNSFIFKDLIFNSIANRINWLSLNFISCLSLFPCGKSLFSQSFHDTLLVEQKLSKVFPDPDPVHEHLLLRFVVVYSLHVNGSVHLSGHASAFVGSLFGCELQLSQNSNQDIKNGQVWVKDALAVDSMLHCKSESHWYVTFSKNLLIVFGRCLKSCREQSLKQIDGAGDN